MGDKKTLILIDGHALAFREYFALERTGMKTSDNTPSWAVYGFFKAVFDLLRDKKIEPDAIAVAFDVGHHTFRVDKFPEYKANREVMPDTLKCQMELIYDGLKAFNIPTYTKEGFEADDVIGTLVEKAKALGHKTLILTGDQDSFQLIDKEGAVKVLIPTMGKLKEYGWNEVYEKWGVYPNQVIDYKALRGDVSDNIPGVRGIGEKTAQVLLNKYKNLDEILADCENIEQKAVRERICNGKDLARLSYELATIVKDVEVDFDFKETHVEMPDIIEVRKFLQKMQFYSFLKNIDVILCAFNKNCEKTPEATVEEKYSINYTPQPQEQIQLGLFSETVKAQMNSNSVDIDIKVLSMPCDISDLAIKLNSKEEFAFTLKSDIRNAIEATIKEVKIAYEDNGIKVCNFEYTPENLALLKDVFENENIKKTTYNAKSNYNVLMANGIKVSGIDFDVTLAAYIKDPSREHALSTQALQLLGKMYEEDGSEEAAIIFELTNYWKENLDKEESKLFYEMEMPLTFILADMEQKGIKLNVQYLSELNDEFSEVMQTLESKIFEIAQCEFNLNSSMKLAEILFEKLGIEPVKRNKNSKNYSTSAEVLEILSEKNPIAKYVLDYRKNYKLKSTYTEALPVLISDIDKKIHTTFNQALTVTGRLSSSNPNLQNIPIRTKEGNRIRKAFISSNVVNTMLLSADYSQIELRLLAHIANETHLIEAFKRGDDVHAITAAKVFDVPLEKVTKEMRRKAKTVNFGIIYGQSKYGLAKSLKISNAEAEDFIDKYFKTYPKIKDYMENTVEFVRENGYVATLFGRKRYLQNELASSSYMIREFAQRAAINQPLQGTAADLVKMAMINLDRKLKENHLKSKMVLQVHDELVLEVNKTELEKVSALVKECMEHVYELSVPLTVDIKWGKNWEE